MDEIRKDHENLYRSEGRLIYQIKDTEHIDTVVLGMLKNNRIRGILDVRIKQINNEISLDFDPKEMITVEAYIEERDRLLPTVELLEKLAGSITELSEYMIEEKYLVFDSSCMYLDENGGLCCICVPIERKDAVSFRTYVIDMLDRLQTFEYAELEMKRRLSASLKQDDMTAERIKRELASVRLELKTVENRHADAAGGGNVVLGRRDRVVMPAGLKEDDVQGYESLNEDTDRGQKDDGSSVVVLSRRKSSEKSAKLESEENYAEFAPPTENNEEGDSLELLFSGGDDLKPGEAGDEELMTSELPEVRMGLLRGKTNEILWMNARSGFVGRGRKDVAIVVRDNCLISKKHAELFLKDGRYYIVDRNSTNRTYLNGKLLQYGEEYEIKDGDVVKLANEIFTVKKG